MKKFENILICTDLDGTLLRHDKTISQENLDAIEYFKAEGGMFTIVTGRVPCTAIDICEAVKPNVPYGCLNGGGLFDYAIQDYVWYAELSRDVLTLLELVEREIPTMGIQVNGFYRVYFSTDNSAMVRFRRITHLPEFPLHFSKIEEPFAKIIFSEDNDNNMERLKELLAAHPLSAQFDFVRSAQDLYEILPKGHNKGTVLKRLAEHLRLPISRTVAVGDFDNDVEMLRTAGLGIAVANASPAARAVADCFTVSCEESAIARVIHDIECGKLTIQ